MWIERAGACGCAVERAAVGLLLATDGLAALWRVWRRAVGGRTFVEFE